MVPPGKPRKITARKNKKDALALAKEIKQQLKRGGIDEVNRVTHADAELLKICHKLNGPKQVLEEAIERQEQFRRICIAECCDCYIAKYADYESISTKSDASRTAKVIRRTLGERYLDSLTEEDIENWQRTKLAGGSRYRNNILSHLRHMFQRARVWGVVPKGQSQAHQEVKKQVVEERRIQAWEKYVKLEKKRDFIFNGYLETGRKPFF